MRPGLERRRLSGPRFHFSNATATRSGRETLSRCKQKQLTTRFEVFDENVAVNGQLTDQPGGRVNRILNSQQQIHVLSSFVLAQVNSNALFVSSDASPPRTYTIYVQLPPYPKRVAHEGRLDFDHLCAEVTGEAIRNVIDLPTRADDLPEKLAAEWSCDDLTHL